MTAVVNPNPTETNSPMQRSEYRNSLFLSLDMILGAASVIAGIVVLLNQFVQPALQPNATFIGILCLFFSLVCLALYFSIDMLGYQVSCNVLTVCLLAAGAYLLFVNWIISGILILLLAVLISAILFSLQISIFMLVIAQTLVSAILARAWFTTSNESLNIVPTSWASFIFQIGMMMAVFYLLTVLILNSASNALKRQAELKQQLEIEKKMMLQKVEDHTRTLNITGEVNRIISTIIDSNRLVGDVVEQIRQAFGYYHVQIYLLQPEENNLKIAGATGEAGTALLIGQHQISLDKGLVGRAASTCEPVVVADVNESPDWVSNSLLPDTVSEIAVPIIWENKVLGVLDVQHNKPFDLNQNDISILQTIAIQLGTAISNVNVFQQAEEQLKRESILNDMALKLQVAPDIQSSMQLVGKHISQVLEPISIKVEIDPAMLNSKLEQEI